MRDGVKIVGFEATKEQREFLQGRAQAEQCSIGRILRFMIDKEIKGASPGQIVKGRKSLSN